MSKQIDNATYKTSHVLCGIHTPGVLSGLVYRGEYMVNWSPRLGTAVSDLEVDYSEEPGHLYFFRWGLQLYLLCLLTL
jgi:isoleucyl-tRNA synthetase